MGNILSHRDSRLALPADDDKWLKMKALAYFESKLQEEYSKLPEFEGTETITPQSTQATSSSSPSSGQRVGGATPLSDSLFDLNRVSPQALAAILSMRSQAEDYVLSLTREKVDRKKKSLMMKYLNSLQSSESSGFAEGTSQQSITLNSMICL